MKFFKNNSESRPKKIQHSFQTVYYLMRFVGLWPFTHTYHSDGSIKGAHVRLCDSFRFLIAISIHLTPLYSMFVDMDYTQNRDTVKYFSKLVHRITFLPSIVLGLVGIVLNLIFRNNLTNILKSFHIFDTEVWLFCLELISKRV